MKSFEINPIDNSPYTLESNKRRVIPNQNLPKHPRARVFAGLDLDVSGLKSVEFINFTKFYYKNSLKRLKILIIGPRNESELFSFASAGYLISNISAIDLFSYSPLVKIMDMHNLNFEDNYFDIVYAGWVIAYSDNKSKAVSEMERVTKKGGLVSLTAGISNKTIDEVIAERGYMIGSRKRINDLNDLNGLFEKSSGRIIYQNHISKNKNAIITCFKKND